MAQVSLYNMPDFEEMNVLCPKCGEKNTIMWFPPKHHYVRQKGTTGGSELAFRGKNEKVQGKCKCGYTFKPKDLD